MIREARLRPAAVRSVALLLVAVVTAAAALIAYMLISGSAEGATVTLFPSTDKANAGLYTNNASVLCNGTPVSTCSSRIDEDIDVPNDADYVQSTVTPLSTTVEYTLDNAPADLGLLSAVSVRYRAYRTGTQTNTIKVEVLNSSNVVIGAAPATTLTGTATSYSYLITGLTLIQSEVDGLYVRVTSDTTGLVGTPGQVFHTTVNLDTTHTQVTANPVLAQTCGLDIVLVIDTSGSIDGTELAQLKQAYNDFIDILLPGTPSEIAIVDFDTAGTVISGFSTNTTTLHTAVNGLVSGGLTNWEDAIRDGRGLFPNRLDKPDLMIFGSDGNPNTVGTNGFTSLVGENAAMQAAITEANLTKSAGIRIETIGIGTDPTVSNLESISSFDAVTTTPFSQLGAELQDLAEELCGGTVSVHKLIDADGNPLTTGDQTSTSGWMFTTNVTSGGDFSTPPSGVTDGAGYINFDINLGGDGMATLDVTETVQAGYAVIDADCIIFNNGGTGTWNGTNAINAINVQTLDIVMCTFINSVQAPFNVSKDFQPNNPAAVPVTLSCASGIVAPGGANTTEATPAAFTVTGYSGNPTCTATETVPAGYDSTGTCSAPLLSGGCTIVNILRTATVNVNKDFSDDNTADVLVTLGCSSGTITAVDVTASESDSAEFTVTGFDLGATCAANESVPSGYTGNISGCATINIAPNVTVGCTIINTLNTATLTVYKDFTPDDFVTLVTVNVTCTSGIVVPVSQSAGEGAPAVFTINGFNPPATCTATETAPPGYSGDASSCNMVAITPGGASQCTIFNNAITETFTVVKDFSDNNPMAVTVSLTCATGTVSPSSTTMSEASPAIFTVLVVVGDPNCVATESPVPLNYASTGTCNAALVSVGTCTITNTYSPVFGVKTFQVFKDFTNNNGTNVNITLFCAPGAVIVVDDGTASELDPADFTVIAIPNTMCTAIETSLPLGYTADNSNCLNVDLDVGSCTIVNSPGDPPVGGIVEIPVVGSSSGGCCGSLATWLGAVVVALAAGAGLTTRLYAARRA